MQMRHLKYSNNSVDANPRSPLKICFILGPQQSGHCGITDYVNLLSNALENDGQSVKKHSIELLNDAVSSCRNLPDADLYSLQFAPYTFSETGLSGKGLTQFAYALQNKKTQVNFHEIWIGAYPGANWKESFVGWRQKREILKFLKIVNPVMITTTNSAALDRLAKEGVHAKHLYLFGNIPYSFALPTASSMEQNLKVAFFGTLYEKFPYGLLAQKLKSISEVTGKLIEIRIIGRQREEFGLQEIKKVSKKHQFLISESGELPPEKISTELQACIIGVSTTPFDVLGKSGATAAMLEHGLLVLTFDDGDTPKEKLYVMQEFTDQVFLLNNDSLANQLPPLMNQTRKPFFDGVAHTAADMVSSIL